MSKEKKKRRDKDGVTAKGQNREGHLIAAYGSCTEQSGNWTSA